MKIKTLLTFITVIASPLFTFAQEKSPINPDRPVIVIGLDGFAGNIADKNIKDFPNIAKFMKEGAYTFEARTVLPSSSAPNWCSMFSGASPELHGFTKNGEQPDVKPRVIGNYGKFPGIFGLMRDQRKKDVTGFFYQWGGMQHVFEVKAVTETFVGAGEKLLNASTEFITKKKPSLMFVVFDEPDHVGHAKGWGSKEYIDMCKTLDGYVGTLVKTISETYRGKDPIIFIVSDHGGKNKSHGGKSMEEMNPILLICGKGIKRNHELKDSVMIYDIAATIAWFKGLTTPQAWIGRPITEAVIR